MANTNIPPPSPLSSFSLMEKMPAQGVTHQHWRVGSKINRQKLIWRVPVTVPSGFRDSRQYLEYQQECYAALLPSGHTPTLHTMVQPSVAWPHGGLLIQEITGRIPSQFSDWQGIAACLAAIHQLPVNPLPPTIPAPENIWAIIGQTITKRFSSLDQISLSPIIKQQILEEIKWAQSFCVSAPLNKYQPCFNLYDCHPANFLVDHWGKAWFVDLEKIIIGHPAIDLAHASLMTSLSWHPSLTALLSLDDILHFHRFYFSNFPPSHYEGIQKLLLPVRRLIWIRTLSWAWDWLATISFSPDPAICIFQQAVQQRLRMWFEAEVFIKMQQQLQNHRLINGLANLYII